MGEFKPRRQYHADLSDGRSVAVFTDGNNVGLQFINSEGGRTRALLSKEAAIALNAGLNAIHAGGGEEVEYEWVAISSHTFSREPKP